MAGLRSQALRPAARSWLTGVAVHVLESAARTSQERRRGAPEGAFLRCATEERDARKTSHRACFADRPPGASQAPAPAGAPLPSRGDGNAILKEGLPGADQRTRSMTRAPSSFRCARRKRVHARLRGTRVNPESRRRSIKKEMNAVPNTSTAAYGFRVRSLARASRNDGLFESERRRRVRILRSFPRQRESGPDSHLGPRFRADDRRCGCRARRSLFLSQADAFWRRHGVGHEEIDLQRLAR